MAKLLLHVALVDLGRGGEAGAQRMAGEFLRSLALRQIATHAGCQRGALDEAGNFLVIKPLGANLFALSCYPSEQRAMARSAPSLSQVCRATTGQVASDEPRPTSTSRQPVLPRKRDEHAFVENLDPAAAVLGLVAAAIQADDLGTAQAAGKAEQAAWRGRAGRAGCPGRAFPAWRSDPRAAPPPSAEAGRRACCGCRP